MKQSSRVVVGTYLVWRRGPLALRLLASTFGACAAGLMAARLIQPTSVASFLTGLAILALGTTTVLWRVWRHARTAVRAQVGPAELSLEPVRGGPPYLLRWDEVRLVRSRDDDGGTLTLTAARIGTLLLSHDGTTSLDALVRAIRAHGGHVEEDRG